MATHPDRFAGISYTWPGGEPVGPIGPDFDVAQVVLVGTVLDPVAAERELRPVFGGRNLCVTRVPFSEAELAGVRRGLAPADQPAGRGSLQPGVYLIVTHEFAGRVLVGVVVVDGGMYRRLIDADGGRGIIDVQAVARPVG